MSTVSFYVLCPTWTDPPGNIREELSHVMHGGAAFARYAFFNSCRFAAIYSSPSTIRAGKIVAEFLRQQDSLTVNQDLAYEDSVKAISGIAKKHLGKHVILILGREAFSSFLPKEVEIPLGGIARFIWQGNEDNPMKWVEQIHPRPQKSQTAEHL